MAWRNKFLGFFLLIFLTSCSLLPMELLPAKGSPVPTGIIITPAYPGLDTPVPTPSPADFLTATPLPIETDSPAFPTLTPTKPLPIKPTATQRLLAAQPGSPISMPNFAHPELGCQWMGVAGQVFDSDGIPMEELVIEFGGTLAGQDVFGLTITGRAEVYGPGGFEFKLADQPKTSDGTIWARVYNYDGIMLSADTYFSTYADCDRNLILLNFVQAFEPPTDWIYLPLITRGK